jgi:hypothetical protein
MELLAVEIEKLKNMLQHNFTHREFYMKWSGSKPEFMSVAGTVYGLPSVI